MTVWEIMALEMEQRLEAFAREISECGDADSGDFSGTACSTAARGF